MRGIRYAILVSAVAVLGVPVSASGVPIGDSGTTLQGGNESMGEGTPGTAQAGDIQFVANVPSPNGQRGSDLEFVTKEVVKLSDGATGSPVCQPDPTQADGCARDASGGIIYQTEERDFALAGTYGNGQIVDITDPQNPVRVATMPCNVTQNDIQVSGNLMFQAQDSTSGSCRRPDGTTQSAVTVGISDISNPREPKFVGRINLARGAHNHTVHPTQPLLYISDSDLANAGLGEITIWDFSNPASPVQVTPVFKHLAHSPHDITFNADGSRAFAAAVSATYILNTENPRNPTVIATIANEGISISHQSDPTPDGDFLLVSDELGGGAAGLPPGGGVHVYDIRNEQAPVKVGNILNDCLPEACQSATTDGTPISTSHVFRINPDGYTMAIGWYKDGVHVIDYSSIRGAQLAGSGAASSLGPRTIGRMKMPGANTWTAKMWQERHPGYVFANDVRGLDVFYVSSMGPGYLAYGTIAGAHPGNYSAAAGVTRTEWESECEYTPRSNGVDGWVASVPAQFADGTHLMTANGQGLGFDLDMYFYGNDCSLLGAAEDAELNEIGEIPEGTAYVMVTNYLGQTNPVENPVHVRLTVSSAG